MDFDPKLITPILIGALLVWGIVRRVRRNFGRQPVQPVRIWLRIGILTLVGSLVAATSVMHGGAQMIEALITGAGIGAALAYVGLRHTRFEVTAEGRFYTPHTYIGLAVTLLFVGRLAYRFLYLANGANGMFADPNAAAAYQRSPLTVGLFALLVGYYLLFYVGVFFRTRAPEALLPNPASPE